MRHPDRRDWLMGDGSRADLAVEELLRFISQVTFAKPRFIQRGLEIGSARVRKLRYAACTVRRFSISGKLVQPPGGVAWMTDVYTDYWLKDDWIYGPDPRISGKYWISEDGWIWGPAGAGTGPAVDTRHWIKDQYIWGPAGGEGVYTGFWIAEDGYIYGPSKALPFVK